jgi:predicted amino acid dehydrogenase
MGFGYWIQNLSRACARKTEEATMAKEIVSVSLGPSDRDYAFHTQMFGEEIRVRRLGVDGDVHRARELVKRFDGTVDAIGLGAMNIYFSVGNRTYVHQQIQRVASAAQKTPVVDGVHLKNTLERWAIGRVAQTHRGIFSHKRVFVVSGIDRYAMAQVLSTYTHQILFGDPIFHLNFPFALRSFRQLERYADLALPTLCRAPYGKLCPIGQDQELRTPRGIRYFDQADIIAGDFAYIRRFAPDNLLRKTIITNTLSARDLQDLRERGVESVITITPPLDDEHPFVGANVIEAIFVSLMDSRLPEITEDDYLNLVARSDLEPQITVLNEPRDVARFAFVIHPLSVDFIFNHPQLKYLRFVPNRLLEWLMANVRPLYLSRVTGVRSSATGKEVEGYLLGLGATPRELMRRKPSFTYRRLIVASRMAQQMGARIMGLGAFTKVVGDAGMTVAYKSEIAITSGNSLTVAATLEAAKQAVIKMGVEDLTEGRAVVIGATGAIGSVCSRLIAQAIRDVVLVAPRPEKLIALKRTIEEETPGARVLVATDAGSHLAGADLVVTTTTAIGQRVIDVLKLKPGCVVCDVARPPDVKEEEARLRPDVLVVESGEILLPGDPDFGFDIGLPPGVAYACLAEAAVLAMEGRFENFTLGRNIEMEKVKEMYRLFKKHGLKLEGLRSFGRYVTDEEIAQKRELADRLRQHPEDLKAIVARAEAIGPERSGPERELKRYGPWIAAGIGTALVSAAWLLSRRARHRD